MKLAATDSERRDIGGALSDAFQILPETSPITKMLVAIGPWSGAIDGFAKAIYRRAIFVAQHSTAKPGRHRGDTVPLAAVDPNGAASFRPFVGGSDEIIAPDPGV